MVEMGTGVEVAVVVVVVDVPLLAADDEELLLLLLGKTENEVGYFCQSLDFIPFSSDPEYALRPDTRLRKNSYWPVVGFCVLLLALNIPACIAAAQGELSAV